MEEIEETVAVALKSQNMQACVKAVQLLIDAKVLLDDGKQFDADLSKLSAYSDDVKQFVSGVLLSNNLLGVAPHEH